MIPYGRQSVDEDDVQAVADVLRSDWLTTGPHVDAFEEDVAKLCGTAHAVGVSSGTAALHAAVDAAGIGPGDEVIIPAITFAATANVVVFRGAKPVFADVHPDTLLLDVEDLKTRLTPNTKAIIAVDYAGQPCDYETLRTTARDNNLLLIADASHSLGAMDQGRKVGTLADMTTFSFHPVKHITTGEGGMVLTENEEYDARMRSFRNHGIDSDHTERGRNETWRYDIHDLGYNYRITDFQSALGRTQLRKLPKFLARRREIADVYRDAFESEERVKPLAIRSGVDHAYHLFVVKVADRNAMFSFLRKRGIGVNVHYIPVHLFDHYRREFGTNVGDCPHAEHAYEHILSLPIHPRLSDDEVAFVLSTIGDGLNETG